MLFGRHSALNHLHKAVDDVYGSAGLVGDVGEEYGLEVVRLLGFLFLIQKLGLVAFDFGDVV